MADFLIDDQPIDLAALTQIDEDGAYVDEDAFMVLDSHLMVEIIDGELVEMNPVGGEHHDVGGNIYNLFFPHVKRYKLGLVYFDGVIYLLNQKDKRLKGAQVPDVSFIRKTMIPKDWKRDRPFPGAPTIAVEVVSPGDNIEHLLKRTQTYLDAGTQQVWLVYPKVREIHIYFSDNTIRRYHDDMSIAMGDLMPDLTLTLAEIFAPPIDLE